MKKICLILFALGFGDLQGQTLNSLEKFKNTLVKKQKLSISLFSNRQYVGEFFSYVESNQKFDVDFRSFTIIAKAVLIEEKYLEFQQLFAGKSLITHEELKAFGIELVLDTNNFRVDLITSIENLKPNIISINNYTESNNNIDERAAFASGYLNYSFNQNFYQSNEGNRDSLSGTLDPYLTLNKITFESHHQYKTDGTWLRTASSVSREIENKNVRVSAGDQFYSPRTFQSSVQMSGVRVAKDFNMRPYEIFKSRGNRELYLETPSTVEIYINEQHVQTLTLEAGKHYLDDIPIIQGINHVVMRISDNKGTKKYVTFQQTGSDEVLKKGVHDFDYNVGTISETTERKIEYSTKPIVALNHRYGLNDNWTIGFNGEYKTGFFNLGPENIWATPRGLVQHNLALSKTSSDEYGVANKIQYSWLCPCDSEGQVKRLTTAYEYKSPKYLTSLYAGRVNNNSERHLITVSYGQKISESISGLASIGVSTVNLDKINQKQYSLSLFKNINNDLFLSGSWQRLSLNRATKSTEDTITIQLNYGFDGGKKNAMVNYTKTSSNESRQAEINFNKNKTNNNEVYNARIIDSRDNQTIGASAYTNRQHFEIAAGFENQKTNNAKSIDINPSGSIAFANGSVAFGQKIQQAFVLVENNLNEPLIINGDSENNEAYLHAKSKALLTSTQAYSPKTINVISNDVKSMGLVNRGYRVLAGNKSGAHLEIGQANTRMVEGYVVDNEKKPYALLGGKLVNLTNGEEKIFFTSREGKFFIEGVKQEAYQLILYDKRNVLVFNINFKGKLPEERNNVGVIIIE